MGVMRQATCVLMSITHWHKQMLPQVNSVASAEVALQLNQDQRPECTRDASQKPVEDGWPRSTSADVGDRPKREQRNDAEERAATVIRFVRCGWGRYLRTTDLLST
jgi:hypothetical protein